MEFHDIICENCKIGTDLKQDGNDSFKSKDYDSAKFQYEAAIDLFTQKPNCIKNQTIMTTLLACYTNTSLIYYIEENYQKAYSLANKGVELNPQSSKAFSRRGNASLMLKNFQDSVNDFKQALNLDPDDKEIQNYLKIASEKIKPEPTIKASNNRESNPYNIQVHKYEDNCAPWEEGRKECEAVFTSNDYMAVCFKQVDFKDGIYIGELCNEPVTERHGYGTLVYHDKDIYVGKFNMGKINGYGKYKSADGSGFIGQFVNGKRKCGKEVYADKTYYVGEFKGRSKHGLGFQYFNDGSYYDGHFKNNKKNGFGRYTSPKNYCSDGIFENDELNGEGRTMLADGTSFVGTYKDSLPCGNGTFTSKDRAKISGTFEWPQNVIGKAVEISEDGSWEGEFVNCGNLEKNGKGIARYATGHLFYAHYNQGEFCYHEEVEGHLNGKQIDAEGKKSSENSPQRDTNERSSSLLELQTFIEENMPFNC